MTAYREKQDIMDSGSKMVLVTGGAGFIGSHLTERLIKQGERVVILDNFNDYYNPDIKIRNIERLRENTTEKQLLLVKGDLRDADLMNEIFKSQNIEKVYHLAAMAGVRYSIKNPDLYFDVNVNGTLNLLNAARDFGKPDIVFASSSSVYGGSPRIPFSEDDPVNAPVSPYAASKKAGELACYTWHHLYDMNITCLRFFTVYGPRQRPEMAIHLFARKILDGEKLPMFGDGSTSRDYTYIDDIVDGIIASGDNCKGYNIYNIGNNSPVKLKDLIEKIGRALEIEPVIEQLPIPPGDVLRTWADISRIEKDLGYKPETDLDQGLKKFVEWLKAEG